MLYEVQLRKDVEYQRAIKVEAETFDEAEMIAIEVVTDHPDGGWTRSPEDEQYDDSPYMKSMREIGDGPISDLT